MGEGRTPVWAEYGLNCLLPIPLRYFDLDAQHLLGFAAIEGQNLVRAQPVAAFRALMIVSDLTWALPGALGDASEIVLGQRIGARDYAGAKAFQREATRLEFLALVENHRR